jgi:hypothetical protein
MLLSSILITSEEIAGDTALPPIIQENLKSFRSHYPGAEHRLFQESDVLSLIEEKFSSEVREAYFALCAFAYRSDLARYCIMHVFGGIYLDLSYYLAAPLPDADGKIVAFRGTMISAPWDTSNGIISAPPGRSVLQRAIELVCANVRRKYYGPTALSPTGPALYGRALAMECEPDDLVCGQGRIIKKTEIEQYVPGVSLPPESHVHCHTVGRKIIAVKRKPMLSAGLEHVGIKTGNAYRKLWREREVYRD